MKSIKWDQMTEAQKEQFTADVRAKLRSDSSQDRLDAVKKIGRVFDRPLYALAAFVTHECMR